MYPQISNSQEIFFNNYFWTKSVLWVKQASNKSWSFYYEFSEGFTFVEFEVSFVSVVNCKKKLKEDVVDEQWTKAYATNSWQKLVT